MKKPYRLISLMLCLSSSSIHNLSAATAAADSYAFQDRDDEVRALMKFFKKEPKLTLSMKKSLELLKSTELRDILRGTMSILRFSSKDCPFTEYELGDIDTRLNALSTNEDPYLKFIGCLLKSFMLREDPEFSADKKGLAPKIAEVFATILDSPSLFVRFMAYKLTVSFYSSFDKQLYFLESNRHRFPELYNPKIDLAMALLTK